MKTKKLLSLLLALMMMLSVVPFYASAAETLKAANVTQWPTLSYKNSDNVIHFGQTLKEALVINDDEIVLDANGNQVAGHFEFMKPELISTPKVGTKANIKFVPDDTTTYSGFNKPFSSLLYDVVATTPVFVDEINDPVVATEVEVGATLSTAILSGGAMTNPYNANEPNILAREWEWSNKNDPSTTVVNESGYYEAVFCPVGYERMTKQVYVKVKGNAVATTITEVPTVADMTYGETINDSVLVGGKVTTKETGEEVAGTFTLDYTYDTAMNVGTYNLPITFKPDDTENYLPCAGTAVLTVNPAPIKFVDENGAECVPEITVPYGTTFSTGDHICLPLRQYLNIPGDIPGYVYVLDDEGNKLDGKTVAPAGTKEYKVKATSDNKNFIESELTCKITVEPATVEMKLVPVPMEGDRNPNERLFKITNKDTSAAVPGGTFAVYADGELIASSMKANRAFSWLPAMSKDYEFKVVYTPTENDPVNVEEFTETKQIKLSWVVATVNCRSSKVREQCGNTVEISANASAENFAGWKITDANGKEVTLDGVDNSKTTITITMPDYSITVEALEKKSTSGGTGGGLGDIDLGDLTEGDSDCALINIIRNIIAMFKSFLQELIETFRSIGD